MMVKISKMAKISMMKKPYQVALLLTMVSLTGCTHITPTAFPTFKESPVEEVEREVENQEVTEAELKVFFTSYFSLSEDEVLLLNQNPSLIDSHYWDTYKSYKEKMINLIGDYLTFAAKQKIKEDYLTYDFHLPKKLQLNEYVTFGAAVVVDVHIIDARLSGENMIYQVGVTTRNQVQPLSEADKQYEWQADKQYYVNAENQELDKYTFTRDLRVASKLENAYIYAQDVSQNNSDEIKIIQHYWIEVKPDSKLQIESIKEATPIQVSEQTRQLAHNTNHIERVPYWQEVSVRDQKTLKTVMNTLMRQPSDFYTYYEKALYTNYEVFKLVWDNDLELEKEVLISEVSYKEAFNTMLNPYKHTVKKLELDQNQIMIIPSLYATKKQPRFIVSMPVKATLTNNEIAYYNYKYYVGMEQNKVESIQFMNREELTEETYLQQGEKEEKEEEEKENKDA